MHPVGGAQWHVLSKRTMSSLSDAGGWGGPFRGQFKPTNAVQSAQWLGTLMPGGPQSLLLNTWKTMTSLCPQ